MSAKLHCTFLGRPLVQPCKNGHLSTGLSDRPAGFLILPESFHSKGIPLAEVDVVVKSDGVLKLMLGLTHRINNKRKEVNLSINPFSSLCPHTYIFPIPKQPLPFERKDTFVLSITY